MDRSTQPTLLCRIGSCLCAIAIQHVDETMRPLPIEPLAGMPSFVLGLAIVRGAPTPVVDGKTLLGTSEGNRSRPTRFVMLRIGERSAALAVDAVAGIRELAVDSLGELPPLLHDAASAEVVSAMGMLDSELLVVLRSARVVPESVWAKLEAKEIHA